MDGGEWRKHIWNRTHPFTGPSLGESTRKADKLFLHVFDWPHDSKLVVGGLKSPVKRAYLLADKLRKPLKTTRLNGSDVVLEVPRTPPDLSDSVVVVETQREIGV